MTLFNQDVPETVPQNPVILSLQGVLVRGVKRLLTSQAEESLDMMFDTLLLHED